MAGQPWITLRTFPCYCKLQSYLYVEKGDSKARYQGDHLKRDTHVPPDILTVSHSHSDSDSHSYAQHTPGQIPEEGQLNKVALNTIQVTSRLMP